MAEMHVKKTSKQVLTRGDRKLIACVCIFALSVALKYAGGTGAQTLREQAAHLLHGGTDTNAVIATIGRTVEDQGLAQVFAKNDAIASVFAAVKEKKHAAEPAAQTAERESTTDTAPAAQDTADAAQPVYAESGYSEDLEDRAQTIFPKQADLTAYTMAFAHEAPVKATLSSDFGTRTHPISGKVSYHFGLDLAASKGTPILSFAEGKVRQTGTGSYGNYLIVDHADGFSTLYAHCSQLIAKKGDTVKAGQEIAQVGSTGNSTGNHLHFEIWRDGKALNPHNYVAY